MLSSLHHVDECQEAVAGIENIVTEGFVVRGQVDLNDFQSMPNGKFCFLLNYVDHGIKKITSIPLVAKCTLSIAIALLTIFTEQGPPSILQMDYSGEFFGSATNHVECRQLLDDEVTDCEDNL